MGKMYIYSKKTNYGLKQLSDDNTMSTIFEIIGIYQYFIEDNNLENDSKKNSYDEIMNYYKSIKDGEIYNYRHYRNKGERKVKEILLEKDINIPRRALRRIASTKKYFSVKTHILAGEIYKYTLEYILENKGIKHLFIEEIMNKIKYFNKKIPEEFLYFQYDSISEYLASPINYRKKQTLRNIMDKWEDNKINDLIFNEIKKNSKFISDNIVCKESILYNEELDVTYDDKLFAYGEEEDN